VISKRDTLATFWFGVGEICSSFRAVLTLFLHVPAIATILATKLTIVKFLKIVNFLQF